MSTFIHKATGSVIHVADHKDHRFADADYERADGVLITQDIEPEPEPELEPEPAKRAPGRPRKTEK